MNHVPALQRFTDRIGPDAWARLRERLGQVNQDIGARGIKSYKGQVDLLTGYAYDEFYDWDLYFEGLYLAHYGVVRYWRSNLEVFLDQQLACGFVARTLVVPRQRQQFKPFLAQIALLYCRATGKSGWLRGKYYERLRRYLDYWFWYQDFDRNGLCVWDSADHSGMDNQVSRAGEMFAMRVEGVDLNCYLVRELRAMALIAELLGDEKTREGYDQQADDLAAQIDRTFWDEADGFYYDRDERSGELIRVRSIAGLLPLWLGSVPAARAERLVRDHLTNPAEFWLPYPVATYARSEPDYYQERAGEECNWRGTCWVPTNYMLVHGLARHGYTAIAEELAYKTFQMVLAEDATREYYNAETGAGQGLNPFWGWSALAYLLPLELEAGYDPTDLSLAEARPLAHELLGIAFDNRR